ncbi:hypothetical protein LACWKB8_0425 [Lactobacillus sp. wkB8]|uniref:hypothetical protein n=1 Tax=Lactobacillus sp. wkB8 TaxID=1545702 RepID=UPI00050D1B78|nr:hypothetical protein [Lactobacillus sp. wkB8]AIS08734.1 hypothetical protein LACWKB8_0425 [Lactobacillus sp. wkB8]
MDKSIQITEADFMVNLLFSYLFKLLLLFFNKINKGLSVIIYDMLSLFDCYISNVGGNHAKI